MGGGGLAGENFWYLNWLGSVGFLGCGTEKYGEFLESMFWSSHH